MKLEDRVQLFNMDKIRLLIHALKTEKYRRDTIHRYYIESQEYSLPDDKSYLNQTKELLDNALLDYSVTEQDELSNIITVDLEDNSICLIEFITKPIDRVFKDMSQYVNEYFKAKP